MMSGVGSGFMSVIGKQFESNKHIEKLSKLGQIFILKICTVLWKSSTYGTGASNCKML